MFYSGLFCQQFDMGDVLIDGEESGMYCFCDSIGGISLESHIVCVCV